MIEQIERLIKELSSGLAGLVDERIRTEGGIQALEMLKDRLIAVESTPAESAQDASAASEADADS